MTTLVALEYEALHWSERADGHWHARNGGLDYDITPDRKGHFHTWVRVDSQWHHLGRHATLGAAFSAASRYAGQHKARGAAEDDCSHTHPPEVPAAPCPPDVASESTPVPVIYEAGALEPLKWRAKGKKAAEAKEVGELAVVERDVEQVRAGRKKGQIRTAKDFYELVHPILVKESQEVFLVLPLDIHGRPLAPKPFEVARGQRDRVSVDPSDILRPVIATNAKGFLVSHGHPSGQGKASPADVELTKTINKAAAQVNLVCIDHLVCGDLGSYESIREAYGKKAGFSR